MAELLKGAPPELQLRLAAGEAGLEQTIRLSRVQRPGLALTGYTDYIRYGRVQIVGASKIGYLGKLAPSRRAAKLAKLLRRRISCFIVTRGLEPPAELLTEAEAQGVPILVSPAHSTRVVKLDRIVEAEAEPGGRRGARRGPKKATGGARRRS